MARSKRYHACSTPGCPVLTSTTEPCPEHGRPTNASWSPDRDHQAHARQRRTVLERDGHQCVYCGSTLELDMHHVRPGYQPEHAVTACNTCHVARDTHARRRA